MDFSWPLVEPGCPNEDSRGIETSGTSGYQVAVLQTLLHQPPFLRWILNHHTTQAPCAFSECMSCYVQQLVKQYWDSSGTYIPVWYYDNDPEYINLKACSSGLFTRNIQGDAARFYDWLIGAIYECGESEVGGPARR